jgi:nitrite reductase (NADH) large subunit
VRAGLAVADHAIAAPQRLVIVGSGMVSHRLCERLIAHDHRRWSITVFAEESCPAYDRVHLGDVLGGRAAQSLLLGGDRWYERHGITIHLGDPIIALDLERRMVRSASGLEQGYDRLVLATGSAPILPAVKIDDGAVSVLRTLADGERLRAISARARRAVVIGGGLLGLETAATLRAAGLALTVIERSAQLMSAHLDAETARLLEEWLRGRGITVRLGAVVAAVSEREGEKIVTLRDESTLAADLVVVATGARPRDNLASWGLRVRSGGGFIVDELLRTSDPHVHAIGECAAAAPFGTVTPGYAMADCLARTLLGEPTPFHAAPVTVRLKIAGLPLAIAGTRAGGETKVAAVADGRRTLHLAGGRIVGASAIGSWPDWERVEMAIREGRRISAWRLARFERGETMWPDRPVGGRLPPETVICPCNGVTCAVVQEAISSGCRTLEDVSQVTHASSVCGGCAPVLETMLAVDSAPTTSQGPRMLALGLIASLLTLTVLGMRPFLAWRWPTLLERTDHLLRAPFEQQATGYAVLALMAVALFLPLVRQVAALRMATWRAVHATFGTAALLAVAGHTGLRLGVNINLVLTVSFLLVIALGATASFRKWGPRPPAPWWRWARFAHLTLIWPALTLLGLHVLAVYYF